MLGLGGLPALEALGSCPHIAGAGPDAAGPTPVPDPRQGLGGLGVGV